KAEIKVRLRKWRTETDLYRVKMESAREGGQVRIEFQYDGGTVETEGIRRLSKWYETLVREVARGRGEAEVGELNIVSEQERRRLFVEWGGAGTGAASKPLPMVSRMFEAQVERTPEAPAVEFEERQLSYRQLNTRANQLAHYLRRTFSLTRDDLVGVMAE